MKAPFPWFGGKRRVAPIVWDAFGDVDQYVEPFAGSLAVLLGRPARHRCRAETINDADSYLSNFWRALASDPDAVAAHADWPVNETDLFARHLWLVNEGRNRLLAGLESDPEWFDPRIAGWWVWGVNAWIGSGWCRGDGPWGSDGDEQGVDRKRPHLGNAGRGVNRQLPHLGDAGQGVPSIQPHFRQLAQRLRRVRVCCGDWSRVVTTGALNYGATVGVFLDPPYSGEVRTKDLYSSDDHDIAAQARDWAVEHGDDPRIRIVLAGYEPEHIDHMPGSWRMHTYRASKAYGSSAGGGVNDDNRRLERLWFSPHCINEAPNLLDFLDEDGAA